MSDLIISGINLMLTGMVTVLIFLSILILLINISASLFKEELIDNSKENLAKSPDVNKLKIEHKEIINIIKKRIFNE
ncbi:MAG: OadG family transporter subunit [Proteobacteria bacterium]|jgi:Na+-transporting methylmalonyl-CoA/oxaloacetate decarboxylase gamma subunit|nr:OadG family transporter subunit [Pseudomonadota bacterium]MDA1083441.1 OadG family transporter subunit [Pseudomonadota bacterium]